MFSYFHLLSSFFLPFLTFVTLSHFLLSPVFVSHPCHFIIFFVRIKSTSKRCLILAALVEHNILHSKVIFYVNGVRLCLRTATTNRPIALPPDDSLYTSIEPW
jgi:hypothetical protein